MRLYAPPRWDDRLIQLVLLPRGDGDLRAHLAERLRNLQAEPARAAGDERHASGQIEQSISRPCRRIVVQMRAMTTLVMFSGGLDSTAMLVKLLAESGGRAARAPHPHGEPRRARPRREPRGRGASSRTAARTIAPFRYSESALDFSALEAIPIDYLSIAFVACQVAIDTPGCNAHRGRRARRRHRHREPLGAPAARVRGDVRVLPRAQAGRAAASSGSFRSTTSPKAELAAALPHELLELTWSCRRPVEGFRPCGACKACRARQGLRIPAAAAENRV